MADVSQSVSQRLRRSLWHSRVSLAQLIAPSGMKLGREKLKPIPPSPPDAQPAEVSPDLVKRRANSLWTEGERRAAVELLRSSALKPGGDALWWPLFQRLQAQGEFGAASLAIRAAVQKEPHNLGAFEMFIEDVALRGPSGLMTRAFDRLPDMLKANPAKHRPSLYFVLPARHGASLDVLRGSEDEVVKAVMDLYDAADESAVTLAPDGANALPVAIFAMSVGRNGLARRALALLPKDSVPVNGLRVTVRRLLRAKNKKAANGYLQIMAPYLPKDRWVQEKLISTGDGILSPYQLGKRGYPFPARKKTPSYEPRHDTSLYLLHNSLPYNSAGYATRTHGLLTAIADLGWNIQGVTRLGYPFDMPKFSELNDIAPVDHVDGIPYHRLSIQNQLEMKKPIQLYVERYTRPLRDLARRERPFVLHAASNHWNGLAAVQAANQLGIESIYEVRGLWEVTRGSRDPEWAKGGMYRFMARMEAEAAKGASRVIAITHALKDELIVRGVPAEKITVVPNGVNADRFVPKMRNEELAARVGVAGKPVIGYIGSVLDYEGLGLLVDAAAALKAEGRSFAVMIVGDGAELETFQEAVKERELDDVVIFTGRVPHEEVEEYYSLVDIAPFPRLPLPVCEMVSPLKPFEAMAMQKAVLASNVAALAEIVQDGSTGLLHQKGDAADLKDKLALLLDDPALRQRLAAQGRDWVLSQRRWSDLGTLVSTLYEELGGQTSPATLMHPPPGQ